MVKVDDERLLLLKASFPPDDVEWRIGQSGMSGGRIWATALAYITNRAIMNRLDEVLGPANWKNEFIRGPEGGVLCGLSIRVPVNADLVHSSTGERFNVGYEWVTKWDGAENTQIEAVKGGISDAMKRAAVQWGIGRYLYDLPRTMARIADDGDRSAPYRGEVKGDGGKKTAFRWYPPGLPAWAIPEDRVELPHEKQERRLVDEPAPEKGKEREPPAESKPSANGQALSGPPAAAGPAVMKDFYAAINPANARRRPQNRQQISTATVSIALQQRNLYPADRELKNWSELAALGEPVVRRIIKAINLNPLKFEWEPTPGEE